MDVSRKKMTILADISVMCIFVIYACKDEVTLISAISG